MDVLGFSSLLHLHAVCCSWKGTHLVDKFLEVVSGLLLPLRGKEKVPALKSCCLRASSFQQSRRGPGERSSWGSEDHSRLLISEWLGSPPWNFLGEQPVTPLHGREEMSTPRLSHKQKEGYARLSEGLGQQVDKPGPLWAKRIGQEPGQEVTESRTPPGPDKWTEKQEGKGEGRVRKKK